MLMVMACVVLIAVSGKSASDETPGTIAQVDDTFLEKVLTIVFALLAGFALAVNSMDMHGCLQLGADPL